MIESGKQIFVHFAAALLISQRIAFKDWSNDVLVNRLSVEFFGTDIYCAKPEQLATFLKERYRYNEFVRIEVGTWRIGAVGCRTFLMLSKTDFRPHFTSYEGYSAKKKRSLLGELDKLEKDAIDFLHQNRSNTK